MSNPFFYGNPAPPDQLIGRKQELRRIVSRITNQGQSTAIVGEPRSGKTSLLEYLKAPKVQAELYGDRGKQPLFSYLDAHTLGSEFDQAQFWEHALHPLREQVIAPNRTSPLALAYRTCKKNAFGTFVMERLLAQMRNDEWRLVLLLDEFDVLLHHPILNSAEFFGSLRSLASRSQGALALIIASRHPLTALNSKTQEFSRTGSPYFNFLSEVTLGPLSHRESTALLSQAEDRFTPDDHLFITSVAGGHPYLLQAVASEMWEAYAEGQDDHILRWQQIGRWVCDEAALTLNNTWQTWSLEKRKAFSTIALAHINSLAKQGICSKPIIRSGELPPEEKASVERQLSKLRQLLVKHFDADELRTLCADLDVDYDNLPGRNKTGKARELVAYLERRDRISELVSIGSNKRPSVSWKTAPSAATKVPFVFETVPLDQLACNFRTELRALAKQGFITEDTTIPSGWQIYPSAFLWWIVDKAGLLKDGASVLIEAAAKGLAG